MNQTIIRFGYPDTLIAEYGHWVVLLRPEQPTLGSLVLAAKGEFTAFSALPPAAFAELARVTADIEEALKRAVSFEKINYLMLMMVDNHVHFHVIPRHPAERGHGGIRVADAGWPKAPALGEAAKLSPEQAAMLTAWLKRGWPSAGAT